MSCVIHIPGSGGGVDSGTPLSSIGRLAATTTLTEIPLTPILLALNGIYRGIGVTVSSMVESCFQVIWEDNGASNILWEGQVGPGQFTVDDIKDIQFKSGSVGVQRLYTKGANASSDEADELKATLTVNYLNG